MSFARLAALLIVPTVASGVASAEKGPKAMTDEEAIVAETQAFSEAWSRGDARAAASFYAEDGARVGAMGDRQHGRAEVEAAYQKLFAGAFAGAKVVQERGTVRMLTRDLAIWQAGIEIVPPGRVALKGHVIQLMKKVKGRWLVLEAHPKLFPPPPPGR